MIKKLLLTALLAGGMTVGMQAQRVTDRLDRGLVALPSQSGTGNFISWRIYAEEYYDTEYNLYRDGQRLNATPLKASNFVDASGTATSTYQVAPVVAGAEQEKCAIALPWTDKDGSGNPYYQFAVKPVIDRQGNDVTSKYSLNDITLADVTGDGVCEFIIKRRNDSDLTSLSNKTSYNLLECYDIKGNRLWYIDLGPNMMSGADEQFDIIGYDWDQDGKAEALLRGADNMIIHTADGQAITIGDMNVDTRWNGIEYTSTGNEYLLYLNGATGIPYQIGPAAHPAYMTYPLPRGLDSDWGTGIVGHRSTKHYFGAPFLDGRKASVFLGRGCYTKHSMVTYDIDPVTHQLQERWRWTSDGLSRAWFGQGYHNFAIADVDWDGRDEIVFGSMVIDDNGKGLSTTGLGHGDAQHCGDLDPYRHGQEQFACNESSPAMNYRDATTSKIYYRLQASDDDGRALIGNFSNNYPGMQGRSTMSGMVSSVADKVIPELDNIIAWGDLNFRIYWDGDLLDELLNSPGTERDAKIEKPGTGRIFTSSGCKMNNWSKNNPAAQGDILGDWREEVLLRTADNTAIRIYSTNIPTEHRNYTLWHDHQYRQGMVWQSIGYNQPPHVSYFLGEMEGITIAPPPLTMTGRSEIKNGGTIGSGYDGKHVLVCETNDTQVQVAEGASPQIATFNVPSWVQGNNNNDNISRTYYHCTVSGGAFTGNTRLVKQGDGTLSLPAVEEKYTGNTDIWAGILAFDGQLKNSTLWLNRFAELHSNGGIFRAIRMDYDAKLCPGRPDQPGKVTADSLLLGFGSRVVFDLYADRQTADTLLLGMLSIEKKDWTYGPKYLSPVFEFVNHGQEVTNGRYYLGRADAMEGNLGDIKIEGLGSSMKTTLTNEGGALYLDIEELRQASAIIWNGNINDAWDLANTANFTLAGDPAQNPEMFVTGDKVRFDDNAAAFEVTLNDALASDTIVVDNSKNYTFKGNGSIAGAATLIKQGSGMLTISTDNSYTGGTRLSGGTLMVSSLSNANQPLGNLGQCSTDANRFVIENGAELRTTAPVTQGAAMKMMTNEGGSINNSQDFIVNTPISGTVLTKRGAGWMKLNTSNTALDKLIITNGTVIATADNNLIPAKTVELAGGTLSDCDGSGSYSNYTYPVNVANGHSGTWNLDSRATYNNPLTGAGTLTVNVRTTIERTQLKGNWSQFSGTVKATTSSNARFPLDNSYGLPNATLDLSSGMTVVNSGKTFAIGQVTGTGTLGGTATYSSATSSAINTWRVGNEQDFAFDGTVSSNANFVKTGNGTMRVTGAWDNTGNTTIEQGTLMLATGSALGKGMLTVGKEGTLRGINSTTNPLTNSAFTINGTVQAGISSTATSGVISFNGKNVTFNTGSCYTVGVGGVPTKLSPRSAIIKDVARLTLNGTLAVFLRSSYVPMAGDSIRVFEAQAFQGTPTLSLPSLADRLEWDTSRLAEGLLFVRVADNITRPSAIGPASPQDIYNLRGQMVRRQATTLQGLPSGIYFIRGRKIVIK